MSDQPKWERQESCPECDGDGCNYCEPPASVDSPAPSPARQWLIQGGGGKVFMIIYLTSFIPLAMLILR